jgi:MFS transporter, MHS family, proline/betaine transporter
VDADSLQSHQTLANKSPSLFRTVLGGSVGVVLEWYDYALYAYFSSIIAPQFFPSGDAITSLMVGLAVFGVGFFMRPLGGLLFGINAVAKRR